MHGKNKKKPIPVKNIVKRCVWRGIVSIHYTCAHVKQKKIRKRSFLDNIKAYIYIYQARERMAAEAKAATHQFLLHAQSAVCSNASTANPFVFAPLYYMHICVQYIYIANTLYIYYILYNAHRGIHTVVLADTRSHTNRTHTQYCPSIIICFISIRSHPV